MEIVTLGGGCFWCLETLYLDLQGVHRVESGYSGGTVEHPTYQDVCAGTTGHAEVVQVEFDPGIVTFKEILEVFFAMHDPTTLNRQGADVGTQYRSAIFFHSPEQERQARETISAVEAEEIWDGKVVTEVTPFSVFYPAGEYHADYFNRNANQPYCQAVINPKVSKFRSRFSHKLKSTSS